MSDITTEELKEMLTEMFGYYERNPDKEINKDHVWFVVSNKAIKLVDAKMKEEHKNIKAREYEAQLIEKGCAIALSNKLEEIALLEVEVTTLKAALLKASRSNVTTLNEHDHKVVEVVIGMAMSIINNNTNGSVRDVVATMADKLISLTNVKDS